MSGLAAMGVSFMATANNAIGKYKAPNIQPGMRSVLPMVESSLKSAIIESVIGTAKETPPLRQIAGNSRPGRQCPASRAVLHRGSSRVDDVLHERKHVPVVSRRGEVTEAAAQTPQAEGVDSLTLQHRHLRLRRLGGGFGYFATAAYYGYMFAFMQNIIHSTASADEELPAAGHWRPGRLFPAICRSGGVFLRRADHAFDYGAFQRRLHHRQHAPHSGLDIRSLILSMALLAVAMKDTPIAANPLIVVPSIFKAHWNTS